MADPHFAAREAIVTVEHPALGPFPMPNVFPKLSSTPGNVRWTGPELGSHTEEVLAEMLGYDGEKIATLKKQA